MGTPTDYEKKIPAEYNLAKDKGSKTLVLVYQPAWLDSKMDLRYYITDAMNKELTKKIKSKGSTFVSYSELSKFRMNTENFTQLSPVEVGKALDANMVLLISIESYQVEELEKSDYYKGFLSTKSSLYSIANGNKLWPLSDENKSVKVGFESAGPGEEFAVKRLAAASAFCTSRYLYDCIKNQFKIFDERNDTVWQTWE